MFVPEAPPVPLKIAADIKRTPELGVPSPPATPATPTPLLFFAATVPAT